MMRVQIHNFASNVRPVHLQFKATVLVPTRDGGFVHVQSLRRSQDGTVPAPKAGENLTDWFARIGLVRALPVKDVSGPTPAGLLTLTVRQGYPRRDDLYAHSGPPLGSVEASNAVAGRFWVLRVDLPDLLGAVKAGGLLGLGLLSAKRRVYIGRAGW